MERHDRDHEGHTHGESHPDTHGGPVHGFSETVEPQPTTRPSQAEGDLDTVTEDIASKEGEDE